MKIEFKSKAVILLGLLTFCIPDAPAQIRAPYDRGDVAQVQVLKRLNTAGSALMIGAHPDDEDTALLSYLARGENVRTAYLSLTRGDGGQNILGPELGELLGVIRTEELLQARKLDGAEQFFTRAYDYGFSKTLAEAKQKWDEKVILCDVVGVLRNFRPLVVISQFAGTPADGHGQHQFAGYIAPLAVKAASDASQCTSSGPVWSVKKLYVRHRGTSEPSLRVNTGRYEHLYGRSFFEIAMEARSQHRSQEQGVLELKGAQYSSLNLVDKDVQDEGIFDRVDTSLTGIARNTGDADPSVAEKLAVMQEAAIQAFNYNDERTPQRVMDDLLKGYNAAAAIEVTSKNAATRAIVGQKKKEFVDAIRLASAIQIDALSDRETVNPGETFLAAVRLFYWNQKMLRVKNVELRTPSGWSVKKAAEPSTQGAFRREVADYAAFFDVGVSADAPVTEPYWLRKPRDGELFHWIHDDRSLPFAAPGVTAAVTVEIGGSEITFTQPVEFRFADDTRGEIRRDLNVVPKLTLDIDQRLLIVPQSDKREVRTINASVTNNSSDPSSANVSVDAFGADVTISPARDVDLKRKGQSLSVPFQIAVPPKTKQGKYIIRATATVGSSNATPYGGRQTTIAYPHIQTHRVYGTATADVLVLDVRTSPVSVGYVAGSGDRVPEALRQLGVDVQMIGEKDLSVADLSKFDTIVVGIRAYQVRPDLVANNQRLTDFMNNGGTVIVQYQLPQTYTQLNLTPYPAQMGSRVADENAAVTIVVPGHPIFNTPNKITQEDFRGWVQERNLYNFSTMDPKYTGLLESHDAGEAENKGGLVIADVGKGKYIYCSYALFRQLPAGVPGAYRLLANLVSVSASKRG